MTGLIKRTVTYLTVKTFIKLHKAMMRSHLEYGNVIQSPDLEKDNQNARTGIVKKY